MTTFSDRVQHMPVIRVATYNVLEFGMYPERGGEKERYDDVIRVIRTVDADVWAIQELANEDRLLQLADSAGLACLSGNANSASTRIACDPGRSGFGVGLMWKPSIQPVPETLRTYTKDLYFHGLVSIVLDVGGVRLRAASTHLTPFGAPHIVTEARRVVSNIVNADPLPGIVGSDSNSITGDRIRGANGDWGFHAVDPYAAQDWHDALVWQCKWRYDTRTGRRIHWADRSAGDILWSGGLHDSGAVLDAPFTPTTGHWPTGDPYGDRDIDHVRVTAELASAVRKVGVHRTALALTASDHLPKVTEFDVGAMNGRTQ